jgi:hypothetical protein
VAVRAGLHTGEVLVSRTVTDLVAGSTLSFTDRDAHELKGIPGSGLKCRSREVDGLLCLDDSSRFS